MRHYSINAKLSILGCTLIALLIGVEGYSQPQQTAPPVPADKQDAQKAPALRVLTRLVQISVIAQDEDGRPVTGLTREDFKIFDEGQEQKITFFSEQSN